MSKLSNIELIIFDMDGLMFDTETVSYEAWVNAAAYYNFHITKDLFERTIGTNLNKTREILVNNFGERFPFELVRDKRMAISKEIVETKGVVIKKGLYELLEYLEAKKYKMAVATSTSRSRATKLLQSANVDKYFECILCGDEIENSKPNPEIFIKVSEKLNCNVQNCVVLEDSENGILAAKNAGMIPILIPDIIQPSMEIEQLAFLKLDNLLALMEVL